MNRKLEAAKEAYEDLSALFGEYHTGNVEHFTPKEFQTLIEDRIGVVDPLMEGYSEARARSQRDLSVKFHWGHHHDFGTFKLDGRMGNRHIRVLANFLGLFDLGIEDFQGKSVLDVGCWTGGTTLMLAAIAREVDAIEEVRKYADTAALLVKAFGLESRVGVEAASLYDCNDRSRYEKYDFCFFPGVVYHLSDPVLGLRIAFNSLKLNGMILVESGGIENDEPLCKFAGSLVTRMKHSEDLDRSGWNWFLPSPPALERMMREAGFDEVKTRSIDGTNRIYAYGTKRSRKEICRAGLSLRDIP